MPFDPDTSAALEEPISPELDLVSPELRARALDALLAVLPRPVAVAAAIEPPPAPSRRPLLAAKLLAYAAWQSLVGFLFGVAVVATVALAVAAVVFVAR